MIRKQWLVAALLMAAPSAAWAQRDCALRVTGTSPGTGYKVRSGDTRCEGMYVGLQAEPLKVQPISFVRGGLRFPDGPATGARVVATVRPLAVVEANARLMLLGRGAESNLNWALDAELRGATTFNWNLADVVLPEGLSDDRIGIFAITAPAGPGASDPVLVPLEVAAVGAPRAARHDIELVFRVPGAAAARWWVEGSNTPQDAEALNADGFFRIWLPTTLPGGTTRIAITWRPRGQRSFSTVPELIRLALPGQ